MHEKGQHTLTEILSQPVVWKDVQQSYAASQAEVLNAWKKLKPREVLFIGCGSTHYLSLTAAPLFQSLTRIPSRALPSSELLLFPEQVIGNPSETLLVAISRSGVTTETIQAVNQFRRLGGSQVWAISCYADSDLVNMSDLALLAEAAHEQSVAQTRSFSSMLLLAEALAATIGNVSIAPLERLPVALEQLLANSGDLVARLGERLDLKQMFFLGSGYQYGVASEAMLKMTEMSISYSEAYHFMEFRHGPMSMVDKQSMVIGLVGDQSHAHEEQVLLEMANLGAETLVLNTQNIDCCNYQINLDGGMPSWAMPALFLPPLQLMAYHRAIAKGLDPDKPHNLEAVVFLDPADFSNTQI